MHTVNIHQAKTHLSKLIERAVRGEPFIIAKSGKPLVKVSSINAPSSDRIRRLGFLQGELSIPDDFDQMGNDEIEEMFEGK